MPHTDGSPRSAPGPLVVLAANPRYFTVAGDRDERAVYLTGSHIWNNLHDGMGPGEACSDEPERMDFGEYLDFLEERGHNFIRLWRWEQFRSLHGGGRLPPLHGAAAVGAHRAGRGDRRQAEVRPRSVRRGVLRPASRAGDRGGRAGDVRRRDAVRGVGRSTSARPRTTSRATRSTRRTTSTASGSTRSSTTRSCRSTRACRRSRRRTSDRWSTRCTTCRTSCGRWRTSHPAAARSTSSSRSSWGWTRCPSGATPRVAVLGDRHREAATSRRWGYDAPSDRDDDAVPGPGSDQGERAVVCQPRGVDLARVRGAGLLPRATPRCRLRLVRATRRRLTAGRS